MKDYIKQIAQIYGLNEQKKYIYGDIDGYTYAICSAKDMTILNISLSRSLQRDQIDALSSYLASMALSLGIVIDKCQVAENNIRAIFDVRLTKDITLLDIFVSKTTKILYELGIAGNSKCSLCDQHGGEPLSPMEIARSIDYTVTNVHPSCQRKLQDGLNISYGSRNDNTSIVVGTLSALLGGLLLSIPWILIYMIGYITSLAGLLIGVGVRKGYEIGNGPNGNVRLVITILLVIVCVITAQFVCEIVEVVSYCNAENIDYDILAIPSVIVGVMLEDVEYAGSFIKTILLGLFFAALGNISNIKKINTSNSRVSTRILQY